MPRGTLAWNTLRGLYAPQLSVDADPWRPQRRFGA
jgi:hypothetical protein